VANIQTNILTAGGLHGDRITQVDMRVAKLVRFGRTRANIGIDVYNLFNSNVPLTYVTTYGATWGRPQSVLEARFAKFSAQIDFWSRRPRRARRKPGRTRRPAGCATRWREYNLPFFDHANRAGLAARPL
jgi:hypothetical protein